MAGAGLRPALGPAETLFEKGREGRGGQFVGYHVGFVDAGGALGEGAEGGVDVFGEHAGVHFEIAEKRGAPVAIGAWEGG